MFPCHLPSAFSYSASSLQPFTAQLRGDVLARRPRAARDPCCPATCQAPLAIPPPASNLLRFSCVATSLHDGRALATYKSSHLSMPCSPTSPKAAISTSSASTRSDARHILLLMSSLIPRRFWNSIFSMHSCRPSAYSRLVRSRAVRLAAARRCIGFRISPRASARMKLARKAARSWI